MSTRPQRLGKYELQERLGLGGMAEVWKALDTQLQRHVAIKLLHANLKEDPHFIARFEREAQLIASLHHPNIVQIHDLQFASSEEEGTIAYGHGLCGRPDAGRLHSPYLRTGERSIPHRDRATLYLYRPCRRLRSPSGHDSSRPQTRQYFARQAQYGAQPHGFTHSHRLWSRKAAEIACYYAHSCSAWHPILHCTRTGDGQCRH